MESISIYPQRQLRPGLRRRIAEGQWEAGRVQHDCIQLHHSCRQSGQPWPDRNALHQFTKGRYALHSQTIQLVAYGVLANVEATRTRRKTEPHLRHQLRYPYHDKRFHPLCWPAQAVSYDPRAKRMVLPMGRGRPALVFTLDLDFTPGAVKLVWNEGEYELHIVRSVPAPSRPPTSVVRATIDLGEIHTCAVVTDTGQALLVSGRGIRAHKRLLSKQLGEIARKRSRCTKGSRRWRRLQAARQRLSRRAKRRIRDARHRATGRAVDFCQAQGVSDLYIGNPHGVGGGAGRHHNQRMARWEYGKDIHYLEHKSAKTGIACSSGDERGTSSRCPRCGHRHKPRGRVWQCRKCGFAGHRDFVGATNMHVNGFNQPVTFPAVVTYRRAGRMRQARGVNNRVLHEADLMAARRSSPVTGQSGITRLLLAHITRLQTPGLPGHRKVRSNAG